MDTANDNRFGVVSYDALNRLTDSSFGPYCRSAGQQSYYHVGLTYQAGGNIATKSDVGTYGYPSGGQPLPHAVASIASCSGCTVNGVSNPTFAYDGNGNPRLRGDRP